MPETSTSIIEENPLRSNVRHGMILMATGVLMAPAIHAIAKSLGDVLSSGQIAWFRFFFQFVFLLPLVLIGNGGRLPMPSATHALRGLLLALATLAFFSALTHMPLADSAAIFFVEPLILTLMSAAFLDEGIGWRRLLAVVVGFVGALIVIRPSFETVGLPAILPLIAAACFALYLTITRAVAKTENARAMQFWVCVFGMLVLSFALTLSDVIGWAAIRPSWPTSLAWAWLIVLGLIATISHMLAIRAFHLAPASVLAPFQYLEILGATLLGAVIFGDLPDGLTGLGIAIIVGSGLYVFYRERQVDAEPKPTEG
ncbi:MAG: DMT family transporter [Geminicoccaceae bacterium]